MRKEPTLATIRSIGLTRMDNIVIAMAPVVVRAVVAPDVAVAERAVVTSQREGVPGTQWTSTTNMLNQINCSTA